MAFVPIGALARDLDVAAARRRLDEEEEEEEEMTYPNTFEESRYEYKIIRSATGAFKKPAKFQEALEEEARAGWELLEKFSDYRVRLRRHVKWRESDAALSQDPYRIKVGVSEGALLIWLLVCTLAGFGVIAGLVVLAR